MTPDQLRASFPHTQHVAYLNHAATGPLSTPVKRAVDAYLEERHRTHIENFLDFEPTVAACRERVARLLGTRAERVEFAANTSTALNVLVQGLDWRPGDRVALPACEFPANVYPFMNLERQGVALDFIPHRDGTFTLGDVEAALTPRTRLLTLSWVQFLSGFRADLKAIGRLCKDRGVLFCVDAIQGLGALRLDVEACGIDFLACGGHKWLMATQGIGLLYVTEALQERLAPAAGWLHGPVDWERFFDYELRFHEDATRFRLGTLNHVGVAALHAALGLYAEAGPDWCEAQVLQRAREVADGLARLGLKRFGSADPAHAAGIVTVRCPGADDLCAQLNARGLVASVRNRMLRVSPTYYNTAEEVERLLAAVRAFQRRRVSVTR